MEFPYQPASASSNSKVLSLVEFTLLQSEVDQVSQYLLDHHWTVTAIHNHQFIETPRLIYLHAEKQDNLDDVLKEIRNALDALVMIIIARNYDNYTNNE
jgi:pentose-5-phosphate-3-epimerase